MEQENLFGIIRLPEVIALTGLARSTIYAKQAPSDPSFDPSFPRSVRLGRNAVGWLAAEIAHWIASRPRTRFATE